VGEEEMKTDDLNKIYKLIKYVNTYLAMESVGLGEILKEGRVRIKDVLSEITPIIKNEAGSDFAILIKELFDLGYSVICEPEYIIHLVGEKKETRLANQASIRKTYEKMVDIYLKFETIPLEDDFGGYATDNNSEENDIVKKLYSINIEEQKGYFRKGNFIYFGEYPKTKAREEAVLQMSRFPDINGHYTSKWDNNRYVKLIIDDGEIQGSFIDDTPIIYSKTYYFKVEPIKWRILSERDNSIFMISEDIIERQTYDNDHSGYLKSKVREWLNSDFFNNAFNNIQKEMIQLTEIKNSSESTGTDYNPYQEENCNDKVFLLSFAEAVDNNYGLIPDYFGYDLKRRKSVTDYALAKGCYVSKDRVDKGKGNWLLRSPAPWDPLAIYHVESDGALNHGLYFSTVNGIAPAITIYTTEKRKMADDSSSIEKLKNFNVEEESSFFEGKKRITKEKMEVITRMAESEDAEAQSCLADAYYWGHYVDQDMKKAFYWYKKAAGNGDPYAQNILGDYYYYGYVKGEENDSVDNLSGKNNTEINNRKGSKGNHSVEKNSEVDKLPDSIQKKDDLSNGNHLVKKNSDLDKLPDSIQEEDDLLIDYKKAAYWYTKAANQGYAEAQNNLGDCYYLGRGVKEDFKKAVYWYRQAIKLGNVKAHNCLGDCYYYGDGVKQDYKKAIYWYKKAAKNGNGEAENKIGECYYMGYGVEKDLKKAINWFEKSAEHGDPEGQNNLGECYYFGEGVEQDFSEAQYWYEESAFQGNDDALNNLGLCYYFGEGVDRNLEMAYKCFLSSAKHGNTEGQNNVGGSFLNGEGVEKDYDKAFEWFKKASIQGDPDGQYNLGLCYYFGYGVKSNLETAKRWLNKAAKQGNEEAKLFLATGFKADK